MKPRKLSRTQQGVLRSLRRRGFWHENCGWDWNSTGGTRRTPESLVRRGEVAKESEPDVYDGLPFERIVYRSIQ